MEVRNKLSSWVDLKLVDASGEHDPLAASMTGPKSFPDYMGIKYHEKGGRRLWPARSTLWLGAVADTNRGGVRMEGKNVAKALGLRHELFGLHLGS